MRERLGLWIVLAVALGARLAVIGAAAEKTFGDAFDFERHANRIVADLEYPETLFTDPGGPSALRPPGFALLLAGVFRVFGPDLDAARVVFALLGTVSVLLLYLLVARVWGDRRLALGASAIAAVLPSLVLLDNGLLSENLFIPLALGVALLVAVHRDRGGLAAAAGAGAVLGLAVLTRSNGLLLALPVVLGLWGARGAARRWAAPAIALGCLALVMAPWAVRNAIVLDRFLPLGTQGGFTIAGQWNGNAADPGDKRAEWLAPPLVGAFSDLIGQPGLDEGEVDAELRSRAITFAVEHPPVAPTALFLNVQRTFGVHIAHSELDTIAYTEMGIPEDRWAWVRISTYALALLAIAGALVLLRARARGLPRGPLWLWAFPVLLFAGYVVWLGTPRYRVPVDPFLALLAAIAVRAAIGTRFSRG